VKSYNTYKDAGQPQCSVHIYNFVCHRPSNSLRLLFRTTLFLSDLPVINFASNYHPYAFYVLRPTPNVRYAAALLSLVNSTHTHTHTHNYQAPFAASPSSTFSSET